jgi:hypothetical protein
MVFLLVKKCRKFDKECFFTSDQDIWGKTTPTSPPTVIPTPTKTLVPTATMSATHTPEITPTPTIYERSSLLDNVNLYQGIWKKADWKNNMKCFRI